MPHPLDDYVVINKAELEMLKRQLQRSITFCREAQSTRFEDLEQEPTATYPGASGYAGSTMTTVLEHLNSAIDCASLFTDETTRDTSTV